MGNFDCKYNLEDNACKVYKFKPFRTRRINYRFEKAPKPRSGHRIVCDDVNVYSYGGYNPQISDDPDLVDDLDWNLSRPLFKELWKFNFATCKWNKLPCENVPDVLASNAVILSGKILMVFGGTGVPFGARCSQHLYLCDVSKEEKLSFHRVETTGDIPPPLYGQAVVLNGQYLYTVGGTTGYKYSADVHRINLESKVWEEVYVCKGSMNEPGGRYRHELIFDGMRIYVLGGGTAVEAFGFKEIYAFNIVLREWECYTTHPDPKLVNVRTRTGYPAPRRCHSCVQMPGSNLSVMILGGYDGTYMFGDAWKLDLVTLQWTKLLSCSLPRPVYFHSSAVTSKGQVFTYGGIVEKGHNIARTSDMYSVWICIPKLKDICWEAILYYHRDLHTLTKLELLRLGLPYEYVQKLDLVS